jgi:hypothetical protein
LKNKNPASDQKSSNFTFNSFQPKKRDIDLDIVSINKKFNTSSNNLFSVPKN